MSGLAASHRYPGVGWMIRDSGNPPSLYTLRLAGGAQPRVREIPVLGAENRDWEDLAYGFGPDGKGRLWIIESTQSHRDPYIYEVVEPDPAARGTSSPGDPASCSCSRSPGACTACWGPGVTVGPTGRRR